MIHLVLGSGSTTQCASGVQEAKDDGADDLLKLVQQWCGGGAKKHIPVASEGLEAVASEEGNPVGAKKPVDWKKVTKAIERKKPTANHANNKIRGLAQIHPCCQHPMGKTLTNTTVIHAPRFLVASSKANIILLRE